MKRKCNVRLVNFGNMKALVSVQLGDMEIRGFKILDDRDGKPWVAPPSREIMRDGQRAYYDIVRFEDRDARREFDDWILGEYRKAAG